MTAANGDSSGVATPLEQKPDVDPGHTSAASPRRAALCEHVTDAEWAILEPFVPPACSCGRKRTQSMRERFFAWINGNRRPAKEFEATIAFAEAFLYAAYVMLLPRLARSYARGAA
jgi:hypothetical protein